MAIEAPEWTYPSTQQRNGEAMKFFSRGVVLSVLVSGSVASVVVACGTDEGSTFSDGKNTPPSGFIDAGIFNEGGSSDDDLYKNDPPPSWCGPDSGVSIPPPIGGTEECPDDKNKPGCGCSNPGETASCWTGLRKHRGLGICKDGVAKCISKTETSSEWGACEGEVLPKANSKGADACSCFSVGEWNIANTAPCLREQGGSYWSYATVLKDGAATGCDSASSVPAGTKPEGIWSTSTLKVDCAGTFKLCFRIRAGKYDAPQASDCILGEVCTDADYPEANVVQQIPDLATWAGADPVCAKTWEKDTPADVSPGYGEMIVKGQTVRCEAIDDGNGQDLVFHRVQYCPRICRPSDPAYNPDHPACAACQLAGKGVF